MNLKIYNIHLIYINNNIYIYLYFSLLFFIYSSTNKNNSNTQKLINIKINENYQIINKQWIEFVIFHNKLRRNDISLWNEYFLSDLWITLIFIVSGNNSIISFSNAVLLK